MISGDPAVRRELEKFELMRIWIFDPKISPLDEQQSDRMKKQFGTTSIPLHVILDGTGRELARFEYQGPLSKPDDYLAFLRAGMARFSGK